MPATPSPTLRADVFRLFGDHGADTLDRYFAQLEYSAVWCARMLDPHNRVRVVIPEGVEDLVVLRAGRFELRQVKSRDESVGAWSITAVLPVLGAQYGRSYAFGSRTFSFHFVSDARADVRVDKKIGSLQALKEVLDLNRRGMTLQPDEARTLRLFRERLPKLILPHVNPANGATCNKRQVESFLLATQIDTNDVEFRTPPRLDLLDAGLAAAQPHLPRRTVPELHEIYDRLLLLIVRRIREGTDLASRAIRRADQEILMTHGGNHSVESSRKPSRDSQAASHYRHTDGASLDEQIRRRAFELYVERGKQPGDGVADWLQAEREYHDRS